MANFFDKKEEVINLELTQYGKYLLSIGKLQPEYYAFYDDDILYDTEYAGYTEQQNESQVRILENTPSMKAQYVRHGIESDVSKAISVIRSSSFTNIIESEFIQQTAEKVYSTSLPMGTSEYNSSYAPSWNIQMLDGQITSSSEYFTGSHDNIRVPQLNIQDPIYLKKVIQGGLPDTSGEQCSPLHPGDTETPNQPDLYIVNDVNITSKQFLDGTYLTVEQDNIVLQVDEINSFFTNENFDIEVFLVEEPTGSAEQLRPLYFIQKPNNVVNDILIDLPEQEEPEITSSNVEYYLDFLIDKELPDEYWFELGASHRKSDVFYNEEDFEAEKKEDADIAVQDLYIGNNTDPFGEEC
tara:strand:- start:4729 stop:5790 length:1062 start_codon:yes stop_codon:yes gene_type:complete